jgi:microcystin-dependent protein
LPETLLLQDGCFQLIGTSYGGDGQSTFSLPDLRGRVPLHNGNSSYGATFQLAETGGAEQVTLTNQQIPIHNHPLLATTDIANSGNPANSILSSTATGNKIYSATAPNIPLNNSSIAPVGGSQPHTNFQPYLCVDFIISLFGIFPTPT